MLLAILTVAIISLAIISGLIGVFFWFLTIAEDPEFMAPAWLWVAICVLFSMASYGLTH
ncbi:MAG: hypothetical protein V1821_01505 [bacterium]